MSRRPEFVGINLLKEIHIIASKLQHTEYQSRAWKCHNERFRNIIFEIFSHGLKWLTKKRCFWGLVEELTHSEVVNDIKKYSGSKEYRQWCMIWVLQVIDEGMLSCYLTSMNVKLLSKFYQSDALLRDDDFFSNLMTVTLDLDRNTHEKKEKFKLAAGRAKSVNEENASLNAFISRNFGEEEPVLDSRIVEKYEHCARRPDQRNSMRNGIEPAPNNRPPHNLTKNKSRESLTSRKSSSSLKSIGSDSMQNKTKTKTKGRTSPSVKSTKINDKHVRCSISPSSSWYYDPLNAVCNIPSIKPVRSSSTGALVNINDKFQAKRSASCNNNPLAKRNSLKKHNSSLDQNLNHSISNCSSVGSPETGSKLSTSNCVKIRKCRTRSPSIRSVNDDIIGSSPKENTNEMSCSDTSTKTLTSEMVKGIHKQHPSTQSSPSSKSSKQNISPKSEATQAKRQSNESKEYSQTESLEEMLKNSSNLSATKEKSKTNPKMYASAFSSSSTSSSSSSLKAPIAAAAAVALGPQGDCETLAFRKTSNRSSSKINRKSWPFYQNQLLDVCQGAPGVPKLKSSPLSTDRLTRIEKKKQRSQSFDKDGVVSLTTPYINTPANAQPRVSNYSITSSGSFVSASSYSTESYESLFTSEECNEATEETSMKHCSSHTESSLTLQYVSAEGASVGGSTSAESFATVNESATEHVSVNGSTSADSFATVDGSSADSSQGMRRFPPPLQEQPAPPGPTLLLTTSTSTDSSQSSLSPSLSPRFRSLQASPFVPTASPISPSSSTSLTPNASNDPNVQSVHASPAKTCTSSSTQCSPSDLPNTEFLPSNMLGTLIGFDALSINSMNRYSKGETSPSHSNEVECGSFPITPDDSVSDLTTPRHSYAESMVDQISLNSTSTSDGSQLAGECPFLFNCNVRRTVKLTLSSTCPTCHRSLIADFNPRMPRKCSYDGLYYCDKHHVDDIFYIPAEMVFNWKFEMFKVSRQNYDFLRSWFDQPVIDLSALCARLHYYVTPLNNVRDQRQYLNYLHGILNTCYSSEVKELLTGWPCSYIYEEEDLYSMHDLVKVNSGEMGTYLDVWITKSSKHIKKCNMCKREAIACKICHSEPVLLTYDKNAAVCSRCGDLVHRSCLPVSGVCTICEIPRGTPEDINKHCCIA
ncbi:Hypothetical predicted protein [Octopus vulgaris]|nr:Hypothetical predicted protein [Octopus vulgaris]